MLDRRSLLAGGAAALAAPRALAAPDSGRFVERRGPGFARDGRPYRYAGANMWYAAYLGADGPARLGRELDALRALGVRNLRVLGSSELSPLKNSVRPTFRDRTDRYNEALLRGLDRALAEIGRRDMTAVVYLTNFWEWSGGMMTYLSWVNGGRYIDMNDPAHPWPAFADMTAGFYRTPAAVRMYHHYVRSVVTRRNTATGVPYADDPAIMAWQLANEPRPGGGEAVARETMPAFLAWTAGTARLIKSLDPHHLVCTGSEGLKGCVEEKACVLAEHRVSDIDYLTAHVWPLNWGWVDDKDLPGTWAAGEAKVHDYLTQHRSIARTLGKPLVIEEFGFPRDAGYDPGTPTVWKDRFYRLIYAAAAEDARSGGPIAGTNFWAWGGEGRAAHPDHRFVRGDRSWVGDPPHEPQGWYSVFDADETTKAAIRAHAEEMRHA